MTEFDNLRTLHAATTPGEWEGDATQVWGVDGIDLVIAETTGSAWGNVAFIVAAHNELPALLARLDEVTAERDALAAVLHRAGATLRKIVDGQVWREDGWEVPSIDVLTAADALLAAPSSVLAAHDAKVRAEALREAADLIENHWAPDSADGEEIVTGSVDLLRARADKEENR